MSDLKRCPACNGRGYCHCECWPADCICGYGDLDCEECRGEGVIDPSYDDDPWYPGEPPATSPDRRRR